MPSSNSRDDLFLKVIGRISSGAIALMAFILMEILRLESRLAIIETKIDFQALRRQSQGFFSATPPDSKYAGIGFPFELESKPLEVNHGRNPTPTSIPTLAAPRRHEETVAK